MRWFFFFNDTATTEIYTLSLHDALPICLRRRVVEDASPQREAAAERGLGQEGLARGLHRSEEHTSELQSPCNLVCRLLLEKKKNSSGDLVLRPARGSVCVRTEIFHRQY